LGAYAAASRARCEGAEARAGQPGAARGARGNRHRAARGGPTGPAAPGAAEPAAVGPSPRPRDAARRALPPKAAPTTLKSAFLEPMTGELATEVALDMFARTDAEVGPRCTWKGNGVADGVGGLQTRGRVAAAGGPRGARRGAA
jgi:hypothetical protein